MQAIANPVALKLSDEVRQTVAPDDFVGGTLYRKSELEELAEYMSRKSQKAAQKTAEEMLIMALQNSAPPTLIRPVRLPEKCNMW